MDEFINHLGWHWNPQSLRSWLISQEIPEFEFTSLHNQIYNKLFLSSFLEKDEIPETIYINCPIIYANLVLDNNWERIDLEYSQERQSHEKYWRKTPLTVVLNNNWAYKKRWGYLNFLWNLEYYLRDNNENKLMDYIKYLVVENIVQWKTPKEIDQIIIKELEKLWFNPETIKQLKEDNKRCEELEVKDYNKIPTISWYLFNNSEFIPFKERNKVYDMLEQNDAYQLLWSLLRINEEYVYRAIRIEEWEEIKKYNWWTIPIRTNFEKEIWPQVAWYSQSEWYAWIIIRIKADQKSYKYAWMQVPRIETYRPHFTNKIEVQWKKWEWVALKNYLEQNI